MNLHSSVAVQAAADHTALSPFNLLATVGLLAVVVGVAPLVARWKGVDLPSVRRVDRVPAAVLVIVAVVGLAAVVIAYATLY